MSKKNQDQFEVNQAGLSLSESVREYLDSRNHLFMLNEKDRDELTAKIQKPNNNSLHDDYKRLSAIPIVGAQIPVVKITSTRKYPIDVFEKGVIDLVNANRIVMIGGETGLGKSSRVCLE